MIDWCHGNGLLPIGRWCRCLAAVLLLLSVATASGQDAAPGGAAAPATQPAAESPDAPAVVTVEDPQTVRIIVEGAATQPADADAEADKSPDQKLIDEIEAGKAKAAAEAELETQPKGKIGKAVQEIVPDTGNATVDTLVDKLLNSITNMIDGLIAALPNLLIALIVIVIGAIVAALVRRIIRKVTSKARLRPSLVDLFVIFGRVAVWFVTLMTAAGIIFPGFGFAQLVATAGLASIAIGFAFQDIFQNFFAGILILWSFPFENGDFIEVDGLMGRVEDVEIRMTKIRQTNGELVLVPNSTIFTNNVTVLTNRPHRRLLLTVGIAYGEDVAAGRKVIEEAVRGCNSVERDAQPEVLATAFGASSIDFDVIWWADSRPLQARRSRDQVVEAIKKALDDAGIEIPYPYRTLTFSKNEPDIIEAVAGRMRSGGGGGDGSENGGEA